MTPVIVINTRVIPISTKNVVAAKPFELGLEPEPEPEPELELEDESEPGVDKVAKEGVLSRVVVAAELSLVGEAAVEAVVLNTAADLEPEPPKQSIPSLIQKNCTVL